MGLKSFGIGVAGAAALLAGCTVGPGARPGSGGADASALPVAGEVITVAVGPCFGFCPVYDVTLGADGALLFEGRRHTAVLGERRRMLAPAAFDRLAASLAPYRPAPGEERAVPCESMIADTPSYRITWRSAGRADAVATHQGGCPAGPGHALDEVLRTMPDRLEVAAWAKQTTRPGATR